MQKSDETLLKKHITLKYNYPLKTNSSELAQYSHSLSPTPSLPAFTAPCNQTRHFSSLAPHHNVQHSPTFTVKGSRASKTLLRQHKPKWYTDSFQCQDFIPPCTTQEQVQWSHIGPFTGPNMKFSSGRSQWKVPGGLDTFTFFLQSCQKLSPTSTKSQSQILQIKNTTQ